MEMKWSTLFSPSILLHLCEAESIFYLDEVASYPRSLNLAKSIAPSFPCACNPHAWPSPCACDQFLFPALVSSVPDSLHTTCPNPDTPEEDISDSSLPTIRFSIQNVSSKYNFVKVNVRMGDNADHYYSLSRFLLSWMLTVTKIPYHVAIKILLNSKSCP